jgi:TatD DNase family protein
MIDVHCHLNFHSFSTDTDAVIKEALSKGIKRIVNVGTKIDSSTQAVQLSQEYEHLYAIVGVHPHHADKIDLETEWVSDLEKLGLSDKTIGIGEIGLDYYNYHSNGVVDPILQKKTFETQIELAHKLELPLQIHNRQAGNDIVEILTHHRNLLQKIPGMFHCFSGDITFLKKVLNLGFYVGFDGNITYEGIAKGETTALSDLVAYAPLDRIVTETDSPYLTPVPHRGERNIPSYVIIVGEAIARIKNIPFEQVVHQTEQNIYTIFPRLK